MDESPFRAGLDDALHSEMLTMMEGPIPIDGDVDAESSSSRIKASSVAMFVVAVLGKVYLETHPAVDVVIAEYTYEFVPKVLDVLLDALLIAAVVAFLSETWILKNYFERRIQVLSVQTRMALQAQYEAARKQLQTQFEDALKRDFSVKALDGDFLRRFDQQFLKKAESSVRRVLFAPSIPPEVEAFLETLAALRDTLTLWRKDYIVRGTCEEVPARTDLYKFIVTIKWTYVNYSQDTQTITQPLTEPLLPIPGITLENQFRRTRLLVNREDLLDKRTSDRRMSGDRTIVEDTVPIVIPPTKEGEEGVAYEDTSEYILRKSEPYVLSVYRPVYTFSVSVSHPRAVTPTLYVFGIGPNQEATSPLAPVEALDVYHRWEYKGWFLRSHGAALTFSW